MGKKKKKNQPIEETHVKDVYLKIFRPTTNQGLFTER